MEMVQLRIVRRYGSCWMIFHTYYDREVKINTFERAIELVCYHFVEPHNNQIEGF